MKPNKKLHIRYYFSNTLIMNNDLVLDRRTSKNVGIFTTLVYRVSLESIEILTLVKNNTILCNTKMLVIALNNFYYK